MSYRFDIGEPPGEAARRAAREQADKALDELNAQGKPVSWRVHQLRKRCKKIRAVARLVRPDFIREQPSSGWIFARILERRRHLREKALELCETALADSPDSVKARLEDYWQDDAETGNTIISLHFRR